VFITTKVVDADKCSLVVFKADLFFSTIGIPIVVSLNLISVYVATVVATACDVVAMV